MNDIDITILIKYTNILLNIYEISVYLSANLKSPSKYGKYIGTMKAKHNTTIHKGLNLEGRYNCLPCIQYPPKKNGKKARVLWRDKNLLNGKKPATIPIINDTIIISFLT